MEVLVSCDGDGHFHIAKISDREQVIKDIKKICDGDHFANTFDKDIHGDLESVEYVNSLPEHEFIEILYDFIQRGYCEIVEFK